MDSIDRRDAIRIVDSIDTWQAGWRGNAIESLKALPSVQPDHIAEVSKKDIPSIFPTQMSGTSDKQVSILADALNGCQLTNPCDKLWASHGWCEEHCGKYQWMPDKECWLKYAEVMASEE